jgi:hypothetical protein
LSKKQFKNLLVLGYRFSRHSNGLKGLKGIESYFPNTLINYLKTQPWESLLKKIGESAMHHLLTETIMFGKLANGCLHQLNGIPINEFESLSALNSNLVSITSHSKSKRAHDTSETNPTTKKSKTEDLPKFNQVILRRSNIFYGKSIRNKSSSFIWGLPKDHLFNQVKNKTLEPFMIVFKVFPRQFQMASIEYNKQLVEYRIIDQDLDSKMNALSRSSKKALKRLEQMRPMLSQMAENHVQCHYRALLNHYCPLPVFL